MGTTSSFSGVSFPTKSGSGFPRVSGSIIATIPAESDVAPNTIGGTTNGVLSCEEYNTKCNLDTVHVRVRVYDVLFANGDFITWLGLPWTCTKTIENAPRKKGNFEKKKKKIFRLRLDGKTTTKTTTTTTTATTQ